MKNGTNINSIHHSAIIQDETARFVSDKQIKFWNEKLNGMVEGKIDNVWAGVAILAVIILVSFWGIGTLNKK